MKIEQLQPCDFQRITSLLDSEGSHLGEYEIMFMINSGGLFGIKDQKHNLLGMIGVFNWSDDYAFVGMLIVDAIERRKGLGNELMQFAYNHVGDRVVEVHGMPWIADLYTKFGLNKTYNICDFVLNNKIINSLNSDHWVRKYEAKSISPSLVNKLTRNCTNYDMMPFFNRRDVDIYYHSNSANGFACVRPQGNSIRIGPVFADNNEIYFSLLKNIVKESKARHVISVPMNYQKPYYVGSLDGSKVCMHRGRPKVLDYSKIYALTGSEF